MKGHVALVCAVFIALILGLVMATEDARVISRVIGATAICKDGSITTSPRDRGVCAAHGGVQKWLN